MLTKSHRYHRPFVVAAIAVLAASCAHAPRNVSFKFVEAGTSPSGVVDPEKYKVARGETVFVDAKPIEPLAVPSYPTLAAPPRGDSVTVVVRIVVGTDGRVQDVQKSWADLSAPTSFARACFEAVHDALAQWKFDPAMIAVVTPQSDGRPLIVSSTPTERRYDVAFTFSSSGRVASEISKR